MYLDLGMYRHKSKIIDFVIIKTVIGRTEYNMSFKIRPKE